MSSKDRVFSKVYKVRVAYTLARAGIPLTSVDIIANDDRLGRAYTTRELSGRLLRDRDFKQIPSATGSSRWTLNVWGEEE